jgi:uncharacterized membrane protein
MMDDKQTHPDGDTHLDLANLPRSETVTALVHLYRGELGEATVWRSRIDTTSHWAVVLSATALSFSFSDKTSEGQVIILVITFFCTFLMIMESRRYRFFDIWRSRVRMLEINFYRPLLDGRTAPMPHWTEVLAHDLEWPHFHMPWWEAVGRRLRRNYQWIYVILLGSWLVKLSSHPTPTTSLDEIMARAALGPLPGELVFWVTAGFYTVIAALWIYSYWSSHTKKNLPAGHPGRLDVVEHDDM